MSSSSRTPALNGTVPCRVEEAILIARPPGAVWAVVADPRNDPRWCRTVRSVDLAGERRWRVVHKPIPLRPPRELALQQLEGRPPRQLTLLQEDVAAVFHVRYSLEPDGGGTRFTQVSEFAWKRLPRVLHGMFERAVRREVRGQLRTLKALLEQDGPHKGAAGAERDGATAAATGPGLA
jgi:uncharacterized protein YndB with AHSA1/START domain